MSLKTKRKELHTKRAELRELFNKHKGPDGEFLPSYTVEVSEEVKRRNVELNPLLDEVKRLEEDEKIERANSEDLKVLEEATVRRPGFGTKANDNARGWDGADESGRISRVQTLGEIYVASKAYTERDFRKDYPLPDVETKTLFTTSGWAPFNPRGPRVVDLAMESPRIIDLIPTGQQGMGSAVVYMEETTVTNNAAAVAEAADYPESAYALTERTVTMRKIAHFVPVTEEALADVARVRDYLSNRLELGIRQKLDQMLLSATGTPPEFYGFYTAANVQTQAKGTDPVPDAIYKAITKIKVTGFAEPSGVVMHPNDWQDIRLLRTADGIYIWGNPMDMGPERIWGLPVVTSTYATENTGLVGDFRGYSEFVYRQGIEIKTSDSHSDWFIKDKLAIKASMRGALVIYRPTAFCTVTSI